MFIFIFLLGFIRLLVLYNSFSASVPVSGTSTTLLRVIRALRHYSPILRVSKLKCSCLSYDPESLEYLAFKRLLDLRTSFTALDTRA